MNLSASRRGPWWRSPSLGRWRAATAALLLIAMLCACGGGAGADEGQAAVVVDFGDGRTLVYLVQVPAGGLSGRALLAAAGLDLVEKNGFICQIGELGCALEACPCMDAYWSYWHWQEGAWSYAVTGASGYTVHGGDVDAWRWNADGAAPAVIDVDALYDLDRLMPALPQATATADGLALQVDFEGDVNNNATIEAIVTSPDGSTERLSLERTGQQYAATLAGVLSSGTWQVQYTYDDPDGINGSTTWPLRFERP